MTMNGDRFDLPRPTTQPISRVTKVKNYDDKTHALEVRLRPVVSDRVYAVCQEAREGGLRLEAGEFLVAVLDDDTDFEYPYRYKEGLFAAWRGAKQTELNIPGYDPRRAAAWLAGSLPAHDQRMKRVRKWQKTYIALNLALMNYVGEVRDWAVKALETSHTFGGGEHVDRLGVLTYRPHYDWLRRISQAIVSGRLTDVITECDLLVERVKLEEVMAILSHNLHHAERFTKLEDRPRELQTLVPPDTRTSLVAKLERAQDRILDLTRDRDIRLPRTLSDLEQAAERIRSNNLASSKDKLNEAFVSFALAV